VLRNPAELRQVFRGPGRQPAETEDTDLIVAAEAVNFRRRGSEPGGRRLFVDGIINRAPEARQRSEACTLFL